MDTVLETVVALFEYQAQNATELSFQVNEQLDILGHPANDPMWWLARNACGQAGLIPINFIKVISGHFPFNPQNMQLQQIQPKTNRNSTSSNSKKVENDMDSMYGHKKWYFCGVNRKDSEKMLNKRGKVGDFIVRSCESQVCDLSISVKGHTKISHFHIHVDDREGQYTIGTHVFSSMDLLLLSYRYSPIFKEENHFEGLCLIQPLPKSGESREEQFY